MHICTVYFNLVHVSSHSPITYCARDTHNQTEPYCMYHKGIVLKQVKNSQFQMVTN